MPAARPDTIQGSIGPGASCVSNRKCAPTAMLDEHREANRANWDDRVPAHLASEFYGVEDFIAGTRNLTQAVGFDRAQLGDVRGTLAAPRAAKVVDSCA